MFSPNHYKKKTFLKKVVLENVFRQEPGEQGEQEQSAEQMENMAAAASRLNVADEVRKLLEQSNGYGVLSTNSKD